VFGIILNISDNTAKIRAKFWLCFNRSFIFLPFWETGIEGGKNCGGGRRQIAGLIVSISFFIFTELSQVIFHNPDYTIKPSIILSVNMKRDMQTSFSFSLLVI
jgi:hypothetical protein